MKLYLVTIGAFTALSSQVFLSTVTYAQSAAERAVCQSDGSYAVFAQHPLFQGAWDVTDAYRPANLPGDVLNLELSHEHIFFCNNGRVTDNIGFGQNSSRFSYSDEALRSGQEADGGRVDNFVPIDNEQYDPETIREVIGFLPDSCSLQDDGIYLGVVNNCQGWTARVREEYWRRVTPTITAFYCEGQEASENCVLGWEQTTNVVIEYEAGGRHPIDWEVGGYVIGKPTAEGTVESPDQQGSIITGLKCVCEGGGCDHTENHTMSATLSYHRNALPVTASFQLICQPGIEQVIEEIVEDEVIPQIPLPRIPRLPF